MDDHNTEELDKRSPRNSCNCDKTHQNILISFLVIALLIFAALGSLIAAHLSLRNEIHDLRRSSAKAIAECRQDVALIKEKLEDRKNKTSILRKIFGKSSAIAKRSQAPQNATPRGQKSKVTNISRQAKLNFTELRKEIRKVIEDIFPKVYVNLLGRAKDPHLMAQYIQETDMYTIRWDSQVLRKCLKDQHSKNMKQCRVTRLSDALIGDRKKRKIDILDQREFISAIKVNVAGIYFVYCQLTLTVNDSINSKNIAHNIAKVTILMSKVWQYQKKHIELISQTPVLTKQGNEKLITVSMFTQAYIYKDSNVSVTISLRNGAAIPSESMEVKLYNKVNSIYNVFGMYLLKKTDDQP